MGRGNQFLQRSPIQVGQMPMQSGGIIPGDDLLLPLVSDEDFLSCLLRNDCN